MGGRRVGAAYEAAATDDIAEMIVQFSYAVSCVEWFGIRVVIEVAGGWSSCSWSADRDYWCP